MFPYQNPALSAAERAADLISRLTAEEKLSQLNMANPAIPRLGLPAYHWWNEALHGVARNGKATMFPQAIALAATFTPEFAEKMGCVIRKEAWIKFQHHSRLGGRGTYAGLTMFSPNINLFRDPRWGRGHETYGECPVLTALMGSAYIRGVQGDDPENLQCAATLKHFAVHSGPESLRDKFDARVSPQDLAQTYLYAFTYCLKYAPSKCIMTAYNAVNGTPMSVNRSMIGRKMQENHAFSGVTVTDVGTAKYLVSGHKICPDFGEAMALEIAAGVDVCSELNPEWKNALQSAYDRGLLKMEDIDRALRNQWTLKIHLGLLDDHPLPDYAALECREHRDLAEKIAASSAVLLKNDGILPLTPDSLRKVAVIGPVAADVEVLRGNYAGTATRYTTLLDGLLEKFGEDRILYAKGCEIMDARSERCAQDGDRLVEAQIAAQQSDLVILCLGLTPQFEGEIGDAGNAEAAGDKVRLEYSAVQQELLERISATGKPIVLINVSGSALRIPEEKVNAVFQIFYPGAAGGKVVADLLDGTINPSGRLPVTFYRSTDQLPDFTDYSMAQRTYRYAEQNIQYPFGYGLSYTEFSFPEISAPDAISAEEDIPCTVTVQNTGKRAGEIVIPFFFRAAERHPGTPLKQFAGSERIALEPGEKKQITFHYPAEFLQFADESGVFHPLTGTVILSVEGRDCTVVRR